MWMYWWLGIVLVRVDRWCLTAICSLTHKRNRSAIKNTRLPHLNERKNIVYEIVAMLTLKTLLCPEFCCLLEPNTFFKIQLFSKETICQTGSKLHKAHFYYILWLARRWFSASSRSTFLKMMQIIVVDQSDGIFPCKSSWTDKLSQWKVYQQAFSAHLNGFDLGSYIWWCPEQSAASIHQPKSLWLASFEYIMSFNAIFQSNNWWINAFRMLPGSIGLSIWTEWDDTIS